MAGINQILRRVEGVLPQAQAKGSSAKALAIEFVHHLQQLLTGLDGTHLIQIRHDGLIAQLVATNAVHVETVERTDLLTVRTLRQIFFLGVCQDEFVDAFVVQFIQVGERSVFRVLCVQRVCLQPSANGVLPEVFTRFHTRVHIRPQILRRAR